MPSQYLPVDPNCPGVVEFEVGFFQDPITAQSGVGSEMALDFDNYHRAKCKRCQEYGLANIEIGE